jgi:hypothetical protein
MRPRSPENYYNNNLDNAKASALDGDRKIAEDGVREILTKTIKGLIVEKASKDEDDGITYTSQFSQHKGNNTDIILFLENDPAILAVADVATGRSDKDRDEKINILKNDPYPFLRGQLSPRMVISVDWNLMNAYWNDQERNLDNHPELLKQVLDGMSNSLKFDQIAAKSDQLKKGLAEKALKVIEPVRLTHLKGKKNQPSH